jgi:uroporphyrinogen decarboxylase
MIWIKIEETYLYLCIKPYQETIDMISHRDRIEACISNHDLDRPPVALWRHFPVDDQSSEGLANATLAFQQTFDFDLVKFSPPSSFCLKDWGIQDEWQGDFYGTRKYTHTVIHHPDDWGRLPILDPYNGHLGEFLESLRIVVRELGPKTPVIQTVFNPLSQAKNLIGEEALVVQLRQFPDALHAGLKTITESTCRFIQAVVDTGTAGIFFAVQHAQYSLLTEGEYETFGRQYDLQTLEPAQSLWLRMLHLHGTDVMFNQIRDYPVNIINWHDRETYPSLSQAQSQFPGIVCGGISESNLVYGTPENVRLEAAQAIQATSAQRFMLGTGCVTPIIAPFGNILAVRQSVE